MSKMFIGDVHNKFKRLQYLLDTYADPDTTVIQLGDMGLGFKQNCPEDQKIEADPEKLPSNFHFIRGNHDEEASCIKYPNYLGKYGYNKELNLFYVSGARSKDISTRVPFYDWWPDEELSYSECCKALELYASIKPEHMVSHDCPDIVSHKILGKWFKMKTQTGELLEQMFKIHQPKTWYFGHYHVFFRQYIKRTLFTCMPTLTIFHTND